MACDMSRKRRDIFCYRKMFQVCDAIICFANIYRIAKPYLSGLREGDHCRYNCCIDKLNSGRLLCVRIKLGRMVESSRCSTEHRGSNASIDIHQMLYDYLLEEIMFFMNITVKISLLQLNLTIQRHFVSGTLHRSAELICGFQLYLA